MSNESLTPEEADAFLDQERLERQQRLRELRASGKRLMSILGCGSMRHGPGCECGDCDSFGRSYGTAIFDVSQVGEEMLLATEELVDALQRMDPEPVMVFYAADVGVSRDRARAWVISHAGELC